MCRAKKVSASATRKLPVRKLSGTRRSEARRRARTPLGNGRSRATGCGLGVQNGPLGTKWLLEGDDVFEIALPNFVAGTCPASTTPLYRLWNNRSDSNHRYTTDVATKQLMISKGYVAEGYGPDAVVMCAPMQ